MWDCRNEERRPMTVSSETNKVTYSGNGSTTAFSTSFTFASADEVVVTLVAANGTQTTWARGTQYTLTGAGTGSAGTVTVSTSPTDYTPAAGTTLVVQLRPDFLQETSLPRGGTVPPATLEAMHDTRVRQILRVKDDLDRSLKAPIAEASISDLPLSATRANKVLGFDGSGNPTASTLSLADIEAGATNAAASATAAANSATAASNSATAASNSATAADASAIAAAASEANAAATLAGALQAANNLDDVADAPTALANLGAEPANAAILKADEDETVTARIKPAIETVSSSSGAITLDFSANGTTKRTTLSENINNITISGLTDGMTVEWWVTQVAAGYTITGFPTITWSNDGTEPAMPATDGAKLVFQFRLDNTTTVGSAG
jgi:hypothetical protein